MRDSVWSNFAKKFIAISCVIIFIFAFAAQEAFADGSADGATITPSNSSYSKNRWYAHIDWTASDINTTTTRVTVTLDFRSPSSDYNWGEVGKYVSANIRINGNQVATVSKGSQSWTYIRVGSKRVTSGYLDIAKTTATQYVSVTGSITIASNSAYDNTSMPTSTAGGSQAIAAFAPTYTVKYNANGATLGTTTMTGFVIAADGTVMKDGAVLSSSSNSTIDLWNYNNTGGLNLVKTGYHVNDGAEWNLNAAGTGTSYNQNYPYPAATFSSNPTVYVNWKPNTYTLRFFANAENTEGTMPNQTLTYDVESHVQSNSFINPGFKLVGWSTDANATPEDTLTVRGNKGAVKNLTAVNNGTVDLYAVWRPIEDSEADVYAGKTLKGAGLVDSFKFRIEPIEGWSHENESTLESGRELTKEELPMPEGTPDGQLYKDIDVTGCAGNANILRSDSFGLISFENPGWYMYKISEVIPSPPNPLVTYDKTNYYVVMYVDYKEDTGYKVHVVHTTAWHNTKASNMRPNLKDISEITDNNGTAAKANTEGVYEKVGNGTNGIVVKFWNTDYRQESQPPSFAEFYVSKNVTGNLGDVTKEFEFTAAFTGLSANTTYAITNEHAVLGTGFTGNSIVTDTSGKATVKFKLKDDSGWGMEGIPLNATVTVTESKSDHIPSYKVTSDSGNIKTGSSPISAQLSTGNVALNKGELFIFAFTNSRDLVQNSGVLSKGLPIAGIVLLGILTMLFLLRHRKKRNL